MKLATYLLTLLPITLALSCSAGSGTDDCNDGADNDGDGRIDGDDPGCALNGDREAPDPIVGACSDGVDNDGDGLVDLDDPGCLNSADDDEYDAPLPACQDGIDNDNDGLIDFPNDPGCLLSVSDDEEDGCPSDANCPACANEIDDDGDGLIDYPGDPGCNSAGDPDEFNAEPSVCGSNVLIQALPASGTVMGVLSGNTLNELISPTCGGSGEEHVFLFEPTTPVSLSLTTNFTETTVDTVLYVRSDCRDTDTELGCNDDTGTTASTMSIERLEPGTYYIVVDTLSTNAQGNYHLQVDTSIPEKEVCDPLAPTCALGLVCRRFVENGVTAASETCERPECSDGEDSDGDGTFDFPDEPGCLNASDNDETDDCPDGPDCPQCSNGIDDDNDLLTDFGADPGCESAADTTEVDECIPGVEVISLTGSGATGTTSGTSNFQNSCSTSTTAAEDVYFYKLTRDVLSLSFSTLGSSYDTVLSVRLSDCGTESAEIACEDPNSGGEMITLAAPVLGNYYVFVDGSFGAGSYVLDVEAVLAQGSACTPGEPGFVCEGGSFCVVDTCVAAGCNDGLDNDSDGLTDFPNDPGCTSPSDNDEADTCPGGADCPECANGIDDDLDTFIDFAGNDPGCQSAADVLELDECIPGVPVIALQDSGATGTTPPSASGSNFTPSCHTSTASTENVYAYRNSRDLASLSFSTVGSVGDTVLSVRENDCGSAVSEIECMQAASAGEVVTIVNPTPDFYYFVFVDGDFISNISYVLNVSGKIVPGNSCIANDTQFTCSDGFACGANNTCVATECNDGISNDADGLVDFPNDPGCLDINDNSEADSCPSGADCPQCGNGIDDDGDGLIDFGSDPGCEAASDDLEMDDCIAGVPVFSLTDSGATGITEASGNSDFTPSCHTSTLSSEDEYAYFNSRALASLTFSTVGSSGDTVLSVRYGSCGALSDEIACLNENGGEAVTIPNPIENDFYFVFVDGDFISSMSYVLNVSGTLGDGQACDPADTQFTCDAGVGSVCSAGVCAPSQCNDGIDNDGDTLIDAFDSGCADKADNDESDDPTPAPQCSDSIDNDADGLIDYPDDLGCSRAADNLEESCIDSDPIVVANSSTITGNSTGATNDFSPSCQSFSTAPDIAHEIYFPGDLASFTANTNTSSYDTVLYMRAAECSASDYVCDDLGGTGVQSLFTVNNVPAGLYYVIVDGYSSNSGPYTLSLSGVIRTGAACDVAQISSGMLSCETGSCTAGICQ